MYNEIMARRIRLLLAVVILALSAGLLAWGLWPELRVERIQPIQPTQMQLPASSSLESSLPGAGVPA